MQLRFASFTILLLLLSFSAHADIIWGVAGPYSGPLAAWGTAQQTGIRQAVGDINAAGGINGEKIVLKIYDDACDPKQAVAVANKLVSENIRFSLHGTCSAATLAYEKTYLDEGVLVITATASNPKITDEGGPTLFRTMYRDDDAATVLADEIIKHFATKRLAIIHNRTAYGLGVVQYMHERLDKAGVKEVFFDSYDPDNSDYSVLITRLKQARVETLFIAGYPVEAATITRQLREAGLNTQVLAGDLSTPDFWRIAGSSGEGVLFAFPSDPRKAPGAQDVIARLKKSGVTVDGYTLFGYAAAQTLAQATAKTNVIDPAKVAAIMHKDEFNTILGKWGFNKKGDVRNIHLVLYRWHDGDFTEVGK
jgi:branched-chain amino acid transport system substrate-binding protein